MSKFNGKKAVLFDLDGTVYIDGKPFDGAIETMNALRAHGITIVYLTNNSSADTQEYVDKLTRIGVMKDGDIVCSSLIVGAEYLKSQNCKRVYALATDRVKQYLIDEGLPIVNETEAHTADTLFMTFDKQLTYDKLVKANRLLYAGARYICTHPDKVCPAEIAPLPDAGSFIALFKETSGREPDVIIGKPYAFMAEYLCKKTGFSTDEMVMVGDRLKTDIAFGVNSHISTVLVLSGETSLNDHERSQIKADAVIDSVADLASLLI